MTRARYFGGDKEDAKDRFIHVDEACEITTLSEVTIRRYLGNGKLRRFKAGRRTLLKLSDVLALIREA